MDMASMMNNPQAQSLMAKLMSDPEMMAMFQKPEIMAKFQTIMQNPNSIMEHMNDPDFMTLFSKLQAMQMDDSMNGGGGFGGGGGGGGGGFGASNPWANLNNNNNSSSSTHSGPDPTIVISSEEQFNKAISSAGSKLVAVDFTATWCGPCKRISPIFHALAQKHSERVTFLKVDGDVNRNLCTKLVIQGFPTFHFYLNGTKIEEFSGADSDRLTRVIEDFATKPAVILCPYKHFPLRDDELVKYADIKWEPVESKLTEYNGVLKIQNNINSLTDDDVKQLGTIYSKLKDKGNWQNQTFSPEQYEVIDKLLNWPNTYAGPVLNLVRIFVLHPAAAAYYAKQITPEEKTSNNNNSTNTGTIRNLVTKLCEAASGADKAVNALLAVRAMCNMFNRRILCRSVVNKCEEISDCITSIIQKTEDQNLLNACLCLFINFTIIFREDPTYYEAGKIQILSACQEFMKLESKLNSKLLFTLFVIIGSLCYLDNSCKDMAVGIEIPSEAKTVSQKFESDAALKEVANELDTLFKEENKK